MSHHKVCTSII